MLTSVSGIQHNDYIYIYLIYLIYLVYILYTHTERTKSKHLSLIPNENTQNFFCCILRKNLASLVVQKESACNPMDRDWWAPVPGVTKSGTHLSN